MKTAVVVASGPSLTKEDCELVENSGIDVLVVNDCYKMIPSAKYIFACDIMWWIVHYESVPKSMLAYTLNVAPVARKIVGADKFLHELERTWDYGVYRQKVHHGGNSGYIAVQLAWQLGYDRLLLLGYDQKFAPDGKRHWFGDHDKKKFAKNADEVETWPNLLDRLIGDMIRYEHVDIVNCSRDTALTVPRRSTIDTELESWKHGKNE